MMYNNFPYHLVTLSPWPLLMSLNLMNLMIELINLMYIEFNYQLLMMIFNMILIFILWMRDIIRESTYQGCHTNYVMNFLKFSMILFILSELFFFISFFWSYFHMFISSSIEIMNMWPPKGIIMFNYLEIALLNSIILIYSGFTLSMSYNFMLKHNKKKSIMYLIYTLILGLLFMMIQLFEYINSNFTINDSVFGSLYFLMTGFHGFHVLIGLIMLLFTFLRLKFNHFSKSHHIIFEFSIWYWHFVDLIWLFLYFNLYLLVLI